MVNINKNILFVGAHPDDIEINAGGAIANMVSKGTTVYSIVCSSPKDPDERKCRTFESFNALKHLGVTNVKFTGAPDTELYKNLNEVISDIEIMIKRYEINAVFTHFPFDTHNDHRSVAEATLAAARSVPNLFFYNPTYPSGRCPVQFRPNLIINITKEDAERKKSAVAMHESQAVKYGSQDWVDSMYSTLKSNAWTIGGHHGYSEVFEINRISL